MEIPPHLFVHFAIHLFHNRVLIQKYFPLLSFRSEIPIKQEITGEENQHTQEPKKLARVTCPECIKTHCKLSLSNGKLHDLKVRMAEKSHQIITLRKKICFKKSQQKAAQQMRQEIVNSLLQKHRISPQMVEYLIETVKKSRMNYNYKTN